MPEKGSKNHYSWKNCPPPKKTKQKQNPKQYPFFIKR